ncbi:MAG: hypothetical protein EOP44_00420 [Sphingobacteriaceae bacterium]|nr:MAG: hypothetical protein EOP44_00420 [Sphingobacteriaceae bacterium]
MKKLTSILSIILIAITLQALAQTKKSKMRTKKTTTVKKTAAVTKTQYTETKKATPEVTTTQSAEAKKTSPATTKRSAVLADDAYKTAIGLKFLYGISLTGKFFIADKAAIEAIVRYRNYSGLGSEINLTVLYEYHGHINGVSGLRWYGGGGAYAGHFSYDGGGSGSSTNFGISGVVGLEYKFNGVPIAVSADWQPVYILNGDSGFASDNGGIGVKYTF